MVRAAVIIADDSSGLQQVYGIPAVRRLVLLARRLAFDRIHVISREPGVAPLVSDLVGPAGFHPFSSEGELYGVAEGLGFDDGEWLLLLRADHVIDRRSLERLFEAAHARETAFLENDGQRDEAPICLVRASHLLALLHTLRSPGRAGTHTGGEAVRTEAAPGLPRVLKGERGQVRAAEGALMAAVGAATRERDSFLSRHVSRRISRRISPGAARTGITPNAATLCNTMIGLAGAFLLFLGGYLLQVAGSLLFLFSIILDGVDGEIARLTFGESEFGHYLDVICDNIVHVAIFAGMAFGLYHDTGNPLFLYLLALLMGGFGLCALVINWILAGPAAAQPSRTRLLLEGLFNNRDFAYLVAAFALIHRLDWFLVAATFGTYVLAAVLWATKLFPSAPRGKLRPGKTP